MSNDKGMSGEGGGDVFKLRFDWYLMMTNFPTDQLISMPRQADNLNLNTMKIKAYWLVG